MGLTLTQRVGEFLHVLVQVPMQAVQLPDIPAGHCFKQPVSVKCLAVSLPVVLLLTSNASINKIYYKDNRVAKDTCGSKGQAASHSTLINTVGLDNTQHPWYNEYSKKRQGSLHGEAHLSKLRLNLI